MSEMRTPYGAGRGAFVPSPAGASATELERLAENARRAGDHASAREIFERAAEAATSPSERARLRVRATHCLLNLSLLADAEQVALDVLADRDELDPIVSADALSIVAQVRRRQGALTSSMEALADALAYVEQGSRRHADFGRVIHNVAVGHSRAGLWDRALALFDRSLELPSSSGHDLTMATMASAHVDIAVAADCEIGAPHPHIEHARELAARVLNQPDRDRIAAALARANQAVCLLWAGQAQDAARLARLVLGDGTHDIADLETVRSAFVLGEVALRAGEHAEALEHLRRCLDVAARSGIESFHPRVYRRIASMYVKEHDLDALHRIAMEMADWFERRIASERSDRVAHVELGVRHRLVEALSLEDPLTKLPNRRFLERWLPRALESDHRLALAVIDLDEFKLVNDRLSYEVGDRVLSEFADILRSTTRRGDVAARLGGDEFILVLNTQTIDTARQALDRLRTTIESHRWTELPDGHRLTVSAGMAMAEADSAASLRAASLAMQTAKRSGRNQVVVAAGDAER